MLTAPVTSMFTTGKLDQPSVFRWPIQESKFPENRQGTRTVLRALTLPTGLVSARTGGSLCLIALPQTLFRTTTGTTLVRHIPMSSSAIAGPQLESAL